MGQDESGTMPPALDVFPQSWRLSPGYLMDDDNQPTDATVMVDLDSHTGSGERLEPLRIHLPVDAAARLGEQLSAAAADAAARVEGHRHHKGR